MMSHDKDDSSNNVKSVMKAFLIMEELDKAGELSIGDLSERLHMDKATVHRLINTIKEAGYVNQNLDNKKYSISLKLLAMGNRVMDKTGVKHISRPFVEELAEKTGETINLGVRLGNKIIYVDKLESSSTIKVGLGIGTSVPSYCSGLGKVILAFTPDHELQDILDSISFEKFTDRSITEKSELMKEFKQIRERGYSIDDEEYVIGLVCIAAPIFDYHGNPVAAISVSSPKYRYNANEHLNLYSSLVMDAAHRISQKLGYKSV
ncbi:MAG: IclR family transcriptional regulator [Bacillota bacterium]